MNERKLSKYFRDLKLISRDKSAKELIIFEQAELRSTQNQVQKAKL